MKLTDKLMQFRAEKKALLAANFYNYETLAGILKAAVNKNVPIILQLTKSSIDYMTLPIAVNMAKAGLKEFGVEAWLHLDHCESFDLVQRCLDAGFDSVMIDASEKPVDENIDITRKVVELAKRYNANVEAELGYVAKLGQSTEKLGFTEPEEAAYFVNQTGVQALAVAIGTAHGFYKSEPKLDLERLSKINESINAALVLHGGSGVPDGILKEAIHRGISKINIATETKNIFMSSLKDCLANTDDIDLRKVFVPAIAAVTTLIEKKINVIYH